MKFLRLAPVVALLLGIIAPSALARTWTTVTGPHFEAEFVRAEGTNGIFHVKEKDYPYPLLRLSAPDRLFIGRILNHPEEAASPSPPATDSATSPADSLGTAAAQSTPEEKGTGSLQFAGQALQPGRGVELEVPIVDPANLKVIQHAYGKPSTKVRRNRNRFSRETRWGWQNRHRFSRETRWGRKNRNRFSQETRWGWRNRNRFSRETGSVCDGGFPTCQKRQESWPAKPWPFLFSSRSRPDRTL